jgi:hypothetical protein
MAGEKQIPNPELDSFAFEIFKQAVASSPHSRGGEQQALAAYKKAESFIGVRDRVRAGETKPAKSDGPSLCNCSAPNLRRTHPHSLVSERFGDLNKVNRIAKWLDINPTPENEPDELVSRINLEFPELSWDLPTINTARAIFPEYAVSSKS